MRADLPRRAFFGEHLAGVFVTGIEFEGAAVVGDGTTDVIDLQAAFSEAVVAVDLSLSIDPCSCDVDAFERDPTAVQAKILSPGSPQNHSICAAGDMDWVRFTLDQESAVVLETSGPSPPCVGQVCDDTRIFLYDALLQQITSDDDGGEVRFSRIETSCGVDALPAGTYYLKVEEWSNALDIPSYDLNLTATSCVVDPAIFDDGFESGDLTMWSGAFWNRRQTTPAPSRRMRNVAASTNGSRDFPKRARDMGDSSRLSPAATIHRWCRTRSRPRRLRRV